MKKIRRLTWISPVLIITLPLAAVLWGVGLTRYEDSPAHDALVIEEIRVMAKAGGIPAKPEDIEPGVIDDSQNAAYYIHSNESSAKTELPKIYEEDESGTVGRNLSTQEYQHELAKSAEFNSKAISIAEHAVGLRYFRQVGNRLGGLVSYPGSATVKDLVRAVCYRSEWFWRNGKWGQALDDIATARRLSDMLTGGTFATQTKLACHALVVRYALKMVSAPGAPREVIAQLSEIAGKPVELDFYKVFQYDACVALTVATVDIDSSLNPQFLDDDQYGKFSKEDLVRIKRERSTWGKRLVKVFIELLSRLNDNPRDTELCSRAFADYVAMQESRDKIYGLASSALNDSAFFFNVVRRTQVQHDLFRIGVEAILHNKTPDVSGFVDPFNGGQYHMASSDGNWKIWSVGSDRANNDGVMTPITSSDIVFGWNGSTAVIVGK